MKNKVKLMLVVLIGLLLAAGLVLASCLPGCPGNGECTVTIDQDVGLYIDDNFPKSTCGKQKSYNYDTGNYIDGCKVQDNIDNYNRKFGTQSCDC